MTDSGFTRTALALDGDERFVSLRRPLELTGLGMNLMILAPGQRGLMAFRALGEVRLQGVDVESGSLGVSDWR